MKKINHEKTKAVIKAIIIIGILSTSVFLLINSLLIAGNNSNYEGIISGIAATIVFLSLNWLITQLVYIFRYTRFTTKTYTAYNKYDYINGTHQRNENFVEVKVKRVGRKFKFYGIHNKLNKNFIGDFLINSGLPFTGSGLYKHYENNKAGRLMGYGILNVQFNKEKKEIYLDCNWSYQNNNPVLKGYVLVQNQ